MAKAVSYYQWRPGNGLAQRTLRERTVRRYVSNLRKKHNIHRKETTRQYQAMADPLRGYQMQIDFGEITVRKSTGGFIKLLRYGMVLSYSRYKYAEWTDTPLTVPPSSKCLVAVLITSVAFRKNCYLIKIS